MAFDNHKTSHCNGICFCVRNRKIINSVSLYQFVCSIWELNFISSTYNMTKVHGSLSFCQSQKTTLHWNRQQSHANAFSDVIVVVVVPVGGMFGIRSYFVGLRLFCLRSSMNVGTFFFIRHHHPRRAVKTRNCWRCQSE